MRISGGTGSVPSAAVAGRPPYQVLQLAHAAFHFLFLKQQWWGERFARPPHHRL